MKIKLSASLLCALALCGASLLAQEPAAATKTLTTNEKSKVHVPDPAPAGLVAIFSNLGPSANAYNDEFGAVVAGPASTAAISFAYALPFTPKSNAHVHAIRAAMSYLQGTGGATQVNLSIYTDANGVPGTILAGPITLANLPAFGTCCQLGTAKLTTPLPVRAGTRYWIVADTPTSGTGDDFYGVWEFVVPTPFLQASNVGGFVWAPVNGGYQDAAAGVFGTIP
jgi:hypothetical protein